VTRDSEVPNGFPKKLATDPLTAGPWPFRLDRGLSYVVPRSTDLPVAVAVRRLRCGGMAAAAPAAACAQNAGCAAAAAATSRVRDMPAAKTPLPTPVNALMFAMISGTLLSTRGVILRLSVSGRTHNRFSDQRFWHDFYDDWRLLTNASTSGPYCSSLRAPMPGIATNAASSVGSVSAIAINVLSVNTT
jgi:hypothetical protein